jgi:hypothetical protein
MFLDRWSTCPSTACSEIEIEEFWTAVAERSGDTAFRLRTKLPKRRGASLPAAVQKIWLRQGIQLPGPARCRMNTAFRRSVQANPAKASAFLHFPRADFLLTSSRAS